MNNLRDTFPENSWTKEEVLLITIYSNVFGLKFIGCMENDDELVFVDHTREPPYQPQHLIFMWYSDMLDFLEKNINKIGQV